MSGSDRSSPPARTSRRPALRTAALAAWLACGIGAAQAAPVSLNVDAFANSSSGGTALDTGLDLLSGDRLVAGVGLGDCWSAGSANRISNANGLDGLSPAPCQPTGSFGFHTQDGESFRFGALVGRIGLGDWFLVGTSLDTMVAASGRLFLAYWDSNAFDNTGLVTARLEVNPGRDNSVPVPGTLALALTGLGLLWSRRR